MKNIESIIPSFVKLKLSDINFWPEILDGKMDFDLQVFLATEVSGRKPSQEDFDRHYDILMDGVDRIKTNMRKIIDLGWTREQIAFLIQSQPNEFEKKYAQQLAGQRVMRHMNQQHEMGSVRDIAHKYGVSLKKVRQLKNENRLHELETNN